MSIKDFDSDSDTMTNGVEATRAYYKNMELARVYGCMFTIT